MTVFKRRRVQTHGLALARYKQGFPIVLVSKWQDLTQHTLEEYYNSPKYKQINWNRVMNMLHLGPWSKRFLC